MSQVATGETSRGLLFRQGDQSFEIDANRVIEVVADARLTRVPHGPKALKGLFNRRGRPVPVLSMETLLDIRSLATGRPGKIIVYEHGEPIGLLVDDVLSLSKGSPATRLNSLDDMLADAFRVKGQTSTRRTVREALTTVAGRVDDGVAYLSFAAGGQLFGLRIEQVSEVMNFAGKLAGATAEDTAALDFISSRDRALPLVSLARLLGLANEGSDNGNAQIIVAEWGSDSIGLIVDEAETIHRLADNAIDAVPTVLQRSHTAAQMDAIGRLPGNRLMGILSPQKLFKDEIVDRAIGQAERTDMTSVVAEEREESEKFLVFELGEETFGLPIASIDEVVRVSEDVTRVPGAPAFVMGIMNSRGRPLPLIDQRRRFDVAGRSVATINQRAIVITLGELQAAFVVDRVREVKAVPAAAMSEVPAFSSDGTDVFDRVAHLENSDEMLLIIEPRELLSRAERDVLASISAPDPTDPSR